VHNTIFSKYLALPIATFPLLPTSEVIKVNGSSRPRSDMVFCDKKASYQLEYRPYFILLRPAEFESTQIVWKTKGLPLTYGRIIVYK